MRRTLATGVALVLACVLAWVEPIHAAASYRSGTFDIGNATLGTITEIEPAGCANGDVLVALTNTQNTAGSFETIAAPSGWTTLYSGNQKNAGTTCSGGSDCIEWNVAWIARGGSAPNLSWTTAGAGNYFEAYILCFTGVTNTALDSQSSAGSSGDALHNPNPPATTAVSASAIAVTGMVTWGGCGTGGCTPPTGYTNPRLSTGDGAAVAYRVLSSAGSEDPSAFTNIGGTTELMYWDGFTITLTPSGGGGPTCGHNLSLLHVGC